MTQPQPDHLTEQATTLRRLQEWPITGTGLHPGGSNYVFVVRLQPDPEATNSEDTGADEILGIYKPSAGERPLRDFPYGSLHNRERAAYLVANSLGWPRIPPVVIRDGPHGEGSVQLFIDAETSANYFSMRDDCLHLFEPIAMFDVLVHNADRKGGSCLKADDGMLWAIDHGLTFNPLARRRTVMFEFNGQAYPAPLLSDLEELRGQLEPGCALADQLRELLDDDEVEDLARRADGMIARKTQPVLDPNVNVPWPFV